MEHVFHLFGGGCGEHMIWPWLAGSSTVVGVWVKTRICKRCEK